MCAALVALRTREAGKVATSNSRSEGAGNIATEHSERKQENKTVKPNTEALCKESRRQQQVKDNYSEV